MKAFIVLAVLVAVAAALPAPDRSRPEQVRGKRGVYVADPWDLGLGYASAYDYSPLYSPLEYSAWSPYSAWNTWPSAYGYGWW